MTPFIAAIALFAPPTYSLEYTWKSARKIAPIKGTVKVVEGATVEAKDARNGIILKLSVKPNKDGSVMISAAQFKNGVKDRSVVMKTNIGQRVSGESEYYIIIVKATKLG